MSDQHTHAHKQNNGLKLAFGLNLVFSIIELAGGIMTNSTAIIADAFHDFMDALAIGLAILVEKLSNKKRSAEFSYGYRRFSLFSALALAAFLLAGSFMMVFAALNSFSSTREVNSVGMLWLALLGFGINGFAFLKMKHGGAHHHHHAHPHSNDHGHDLEHNQNSRAIMLHLLEDVLGWVAVLVGSIVIYFTGWTWVDGALALAIAIFIGYNAGKMLRNTFKLLLQAVPNNVNIAALTTEIMSLPGIQDIHDLHIWSLDGSFNIASLHVVVTEESKAISEQRFASIIKILREHHVQHPTVQIEKADQPCSFRNC
jgi:cobalt-zinc-cadmium efflux system protein